MFLFTTFKNKHLEQKNKIQSQEGASFQPFLEAGGLKIWGWSEQYTHVHTERKRQKHTHMYKHIYHIMLYMTYTLVPFKRCLLGISVASANPLWRKNAAEVISDKPGTICWGYWFCLRLSHSVGTEFPIFCTPGKRWWCWSWQSSWGVLLDTFLVRVLYKT